MGYQHYVLRDAPRDIVLFDHIDAALARLQKERGLDLRYAFFRDLADNLGEHVYMEVRERALLHLVEDFETPVRYLQIGAKDLATIEGIAAVLAGFVDLESLAELQARARQEMQTNPTVLIRLGLGAGGQVDPQTLEILSQGLRAEVPEIRRRAAEAVSLTHWPELIPLLKELEANDPSSEVREMVGWALEACGSPRSLG